MGILDTIHSPNDLRKLHLSEMKELASEIREFLVKNVSVTGGHLASNLGVVELTLALHRVFHAPEDKIIWDVGHQSYVHKIITGRRDQFPTLRQEGGLSGFPKMQESPYDAFDTGHATTSISAAYGMAKARDLQGQHYEVVAVIGDGSLTGGMAYEAMNNAGKNKTRLIVVLNDNNMAINKNIGALAAHLNRLRTRKSYLESKSLVRAGVAKYPALKPVYNVADHLKNNIKYILVKGILFEELGFTYLGPVDGHDMKALVEVFHQARNVEKPVLVHVITVKGKGYGPAQMDPCKFHGVKGFNEVSGDVVCEKGSTYADVAGTTLSRMESTDDRIVAITAAMAGGVGLDHFQDKTHLFDVGIAEEHAVTFAAGLAAGGMRPFVCVYSTFLQRAYDQIVHDMCLPSLPVVLMVDHAGIVGEDGETHQGIFDIAFLSSIPNLTFLAPSCSEELVQMMEYVLSRKAPSAIRYPKGCAWSLTKESFPDLPVILPGEVRLEQGKSQTVVAGSWAQQASGRADSVSLGKLPIVIISTGTRLRASLTACQQLWKEECQATVINARFLSPIDTNLLDRFLAHPCHVITVEEGVRSGGFGTQTAAYLAEHSFAGTITILSLPDKFIEQGTRSHLLEKYGLDSRGILKACRDADGGRV